MRILIIAPTPFFSDRGTPIRVYEHIQSLKTLGHSILSVTYGAGKDIAGMDIVRVPTPWRGDDFFIEAFWRRILLDILMIFVVAWKRWRYKPDLVICYLHSGFLIGYITSFFSSKKIIFDCHGILVNEVMDKQIVRNRFILSGLKYIEVLIYRLAKRITVPSNVVKQKILNTYPMDSRKVFIVNDSIASAVLDYQRNTEAISQLRSDLGISPSHRVIIFTGFISAIAGIDTLLQAMHLLVKKTGDIVLVIVGYPHEEQYRELARKYGVDKLVRFVGRVNYFHLPLYLDLADVAVAPRISGAEGNSKILNYLAIGLPVVCFDIPINRELVDDFAFYPKALTADALAESLKEAFLNLKELQKKKDERISYVKNKYSRNEMVDFINQTNLQ